jgi:site-specific recombinase XerD
VAFRVLATVAGKQLKRIVPTREEAELLAKQWREGQALSLNYLPTRFSPSELEAAEAAHYMITAKLGLSLSDAAAWILQNYRPERTGPRSPDLSTAIDQFLATKSSLSNSQQKSLRSTLVRLRDRLRKKRQPADITEQELRSFLHWLCAKRAPKTWNIHLENLRGFFGWMKARQWVERSPANLIEPKKVIRGLPEVLSASTARTLMEDVEANYPRFVPYFVLTLFGAVRAGVREGECQRLDALLRNGETPVRGGGLVIAGKTGRERIVPWTEPLRRWLTAHPLGQELLPDGENAAEAAISRIRAKHGLGRNVLRHTGITGMALSIDSIVTTAIACDTSESIIRRHYLGQWTKAEAQDFYAISPRGIEPR